MKRKREILGIIIIFTVMVIALTFAAHMENSRLVENIKFTVFCDDNPKDISMFNNGDTNYVFLPASATKKKVTVKYSGGNSLTLLIGERQFKNGDVIDNIETDKVLDIRLKGLFGREISKSKIVFLKSSNIPALMLSLSDGTIEGINSKKESKRKGTVAAYDSDGNVVYNGNFLSLHSRGNASWLSNKKPYTLEFENEVNLFGLGSSSKWVLLANAYDGTNIKNKIAFDSSEKIGMKYSCHSTWIDLYADGEYLGLYLLSEKIVLSENKIDIKNLAEDIQKANYKPLSSYKKEEFEIDGHQARAYDIPNTPNDISGGYIIKSEMMSRISEDSFFSTSMGTYDCESPKFLTRECAEYLYGYFNDIYACLDDFNEISKYLDINSFAERYLIQECFANCEGSSYYYIKNSDSIDGKLYAGPVWDFDNSLGRGDTVSPTGMYSSSGIFNSLLQHREFSGLVRHLYKNQMRGIMISIVEDEMWKYLDILRQSSEMNRIRWNGLESTEKDFDEYIGDLSDYLKDRIAFLDKIWINNEAFSTIIFNDETNVIDFYYSTSLLKGECVGESCDLSSNAYKFLGWFDSETGEKFDSTEKYTENHYFIAKWEDNENYQKEHLIIPKNANDLIEDLYLVKKMVLKNYETIISVVLFVCFGALSVCLWICERKKNTGR